MASGRLTEADIDHIFSVFDADNSGSISSEEYRTALLALGYGKVTASEAATMMGDRPSLTRGEFATVIKKHSAAPNSMAECKRAFKLFDPKGTGKITSDLLMKAGTAAMGSTPSLDLVNRIMAACDQDGDRVIDFDEFLAAVSLKLKIAPDPSTAAASRTQQGGAAAAAAADDEDAADEGRGAGSSSTPAITVIPPGAQVKRICGHDCIFNAQGLLDKRGARQHMIKFEYTADVLNDEGLEEIFNEQDKDGDGFINEEEYKEMLTGLGESP